MHYQTHRPKPPVGQWIEEVIHYSGFNPDHSIERLVPTGHMSILFALDGKTRHTYDAEHLHVMGTHQDVWIYGMHRHYLSISAHADSEMLILRFGTPGALPFLHRSLHQFSDRLLGAAQALDGELPQLHNAVLAAAGSDAKFAVIDAWLAARYRSELEPPVWVLDAIGQLREAPAQRYADIVARYPRSQKDLIAQFRRHVGMTPKYYHRLLRFGDVFRRMQGHQPIDWVETALQCGYTDQPHFIREFRHFSGFTPQRFAAAGYDLELPNYFALDRDG